MYTNAFETVRAKVPGELVERFPEALRREALRQTGLHLADADALNAFAMRLVEQSEVTQDFGSGALFRASIESMFHKMRADSSNWHLEILSLFQLDCPVRRSCRRSVPRMAADCGSAGHGPVTAGIATHQQAHDQDKREVGKGSLRSESGQFLIWDNPALTVRTNATPWLCNMAIGDAHSVVLPIGPRLLLALGRRNIVGTIPRATVNQLNTVQVLAADRYVYMHPLSTRLEAFAKETAHRRRPDPVSPYLASTSATGSKRYPTKPTATDRSQGQRHHLGHTPPGITVVSSICHHRSNPRPGNRAAQGCWSARFPSVAVRSVAAARPGRATLPLIICRLILAVGTKVRQPAE
ncbi:DUF4238 domain-containing protein [Streptomyces sp. NPDC017943]|uniref:DUF4238 domain-containing protein n=1 Tax=Streptomyces sp. NPDC017943 TaxID=3365019 RepID=UPI00379E1A4B